MGNAHIDQPAPAGLLLLLLPATAHRIGPGLQITTLADPPMLYCTFILEYAPPGTILAQLIGEKKGAEIKGENAEEKA